MNPAYDYVRQMQLKEEELLRLFQESLLPEEKEAVKAYIQITHSENPKNDIERGRRNFMLMCFVDGIRWLRSRLDVPITDIEQAVAEAAYAEIRRWAPDVHSFSKETIITVLLARGREILARKNTPT